MNIVKKKKKKKTFLYPYYKLKGKEGLAGTTSKSRNQTRSE